MMWNLHLAVALLLVILSVGSAEDATYLVVSPSSFRSGSTLSVSVTVFSGASSVTAELLADKTQVATSGAVSVTQGVPTKVPLQVPSNVQAGPTYTLKVKGTAGVLFENSTTIKHDPKTMSVFIQTDKAIYKPGQTVHFRAFAVTPDLRPYTGAIDVEIYDKQQNLIKQMQNQQTASGVVSGDLELASQTILGNWKIRVTAMGQTEEQEFEVDEYVLPKFEVKVTLPSYSLNSHSQIAGKVEAKYTYGKAVKGTLTVKAELVQNYYIARPFSPLDRPMFQPKPKAVMMSKPIDGSADFAFSMSDLKLILKSNGDFYSGEELVITANVTETLTSITQSGNGTVKVYTKETMVTLLDSSPDNFKPGMKYTAFVSVTKPDGSLWPASKNLQFDVKTRASYSDSLTTISTLTVPESGILVVDIERDSDSSFMFQVVMTTDRTVSTNEKWVNPFKSRDPQSIQVSLSNGNAGLKSGQTATFEVKSNVSIPSFSYMIISRGSIHSVGQVVAGGMSKDFSIVLTPTMGPSSKMLVMLLTSNGEVITDSVQFSVEGTLENKVSVRFVDDSDQEVTKTNIGTNVTFEVTADSGSHVFVRAVDQSVLLLKKGNDITVEEVVGELEEYGKVDNGLPPCWGCDFRRRKRSIWWPYFPGGANSFEVFEKAGLVVMSDAFLYQEPDRFWAQGPVFGMADRADEAMGVDDAASGGSGGASQLASPTKVRKLFPETWLWTNVVASANGVAKIEATVPDTITSWVAGAFALHSNTGLGVAPTSVMLEAFQPFFVTINMPYSIVRGEETVLFALVFNYMEEDMDVVVTLDKSDEFTVREANALEPESKTVTSRITVPSGTGNSTTFNIVPTMRGNIKIKLTAQSSKAADAVERILIVKPEGAPQFFTQSMLVNLDDGPFDETVTITVPDDAVKDSETVTVSAIGDIMGPTLDNLENLIRQPTGCGEQNMLGLVPNIMVRKYLAAVNKLTAKITADTGKYMNRGVQREMTYQHDDKDLYNKGSFSAFGNSDKNGSMWLTAYVVKTFMEASVFADVTVDMKKMKESMVWMLKKQYANGSFPEPGRVIHADMQGGVGAGTSPKMTAYVLTSLLAMEGKLVSPQDDQLIADVAAAKSKAITLLEGLVTSGALDSTKEMYTLALVTYALTLANSGQADTALAKLNNMATIEGNEMYWIKEAESEDTKNLGPSRWYWHKAMTYDVEMTSYALLTYIKKNNLVDAVKIVKWLTKQRNDRGGFSSTQDTVLGLTALAEFATAQSKSSTNVAVTVTESGTARTFETMTEDNALILQKMMLPPSARQVRVQATGTGLALVTVSMLYYTMNIPKKPSIEITNEVKQENYGNLLIVKTCGKWMDSDSDSNMVVAEMDLLSGYGTDKDELMKLAPKMVKKVEMNGETIQWYLDELPKGETVCLTAKQQRVMPVGDLKPAVVKMSSYYNPEKEATVLYSIASQVDICDQCGADCASLNCKDPVPTTTPKTTDPSGATSATANVLLLLAGMFIMLLQQ